MVLSKLHNPLDISAQTVLPDREKSAVTARYGIREFYTLFSM